MEDRAKNVLNLYIYIYIYIYIFRLVPPKNIQLPIHVRMNEYAHI